MIRSIAAVLLLLACPAAVHAQLSTEEPGWSILVISIADACGAESGRVEEAADYVAAWAEKNLPEPSRLTKEKALERIRDNADIRRTLRDQGRFIYPCSRWMQVFDLFIASKGAVMDRDRAGDDRQSGTQTPPGWKSREGKCRFAFAPPDPAIDRVDVRFETEEGLRLELSFAVAVKGLAPLGPRQRDGCRFHQELRVSVTLAGRKYATIQTASTACDAAGDRIGAETQFLDVKVSGEQAVTAFTDALTASPTVLLRLENGLKRNTTLAVSTAGLRDLVRATEICPAPVLRAVAR